ncbi:hypothetical protein [Ilyobacter sp.]|uniref:hypothetical protein n=1 Tax=Ilyobacter sp. TaxID=3100343 RepID=UPI0035638D95
MKIAIMKNPVNINSNNICVDFLEAIGAECEYLFNQIKIKKGLYILMPLNLTRGAPNSWGYPVYLAKVCVAIHMPERRNRMNI